MNNGPHPDCVNGPITQSRTTGRQFTGHFFSLAITCLVFAANVHARHKTSARAETLCALPRNDPIKSAMCGISFGRSLQTRRLKSACSALSQACKGASPPRLPRLVPPVPFHPGEFDAGGKKKIVGGKKKTTKVQVGGRASASKDAARHFYCVASEEREG